MAESSQRAEGARSAPSADPRPSQTAKVLLGKPETRRFLMDFVKRRVPEAHVDDVVQTVLISALESPSTPTTEPELRRWLTGVAKHKIADQHRKGGREQPTELPDIEANPPPVEERSLARWAEGRAIASKDAARTLRWMAREGEGEKLEQIAVEENVEPAAVRQRVSRMRRWMKEQWALELALVAALALVGVMVWQALRTEPKRDDVPRAETPRERARDIRQTGLRACEAKAFEECLRELDRAREIDPDGDRAPEVQGARKAAGDALQIQPKSSDRLPAPEQQRDPAPSSSALADGNDPVPATPSATPSAVAPPLPPTPQSTAKPTPTSVQQKTSTPKKPAETNGPPETNVTGGPSAQTNAPPAPQQMTPSMPPQTQQAPQMFQTKSAKP
ncbi:MAG: sigma factor [Polyangiaceae bacterium]